MDFFKDKNSEKLYHQPIFKHDPNNPFFYNLEKCTGGPKELKDWAAQHKLNEQRELRKLDPKSRVEARYQLTKRKQITPITSEADALKVIMKAIKIWKSRKAQRKVMMMRKQGLGGVVNTIEVE